MKQIRTLGKAEDIEMHCETRLKGSPKRIYQNNVKKYFLAVARLAGFSSPMESSVQHSAHLQHISWSPNLCSPFQFLWDSHNPNTAHHEGGKTKPTFQPFSRQEIHLIQVPQGHTLSPASPGNTDWKGFVCLYKERSQNRSITERHRLRRAKSMSFDLWLFKLPCQKIFLKMQISATTFSSNLVLLSPHLPVVA